MNAPLEQIGKLILLTGVFIAVVGLLLILADKIPFIGKLPGDILIRRKNFTFYFPLGTSILLSIILSLVLYFLGRR